MQVGELVLAGAMHGNLVSAAHLKFEITGDIYETFIAAIGVTTTERGKGGALADLTLWKIRQEGLAQASGRGCSHLVLIGKVHTKNSSSQLMVERAGCEPYGAPLSGYQTWSRTVEVT